MQLKGYRKFIFALVVVLSSGLLLIFNKLTGDQYVALATATTIGYLGANAVQAVGVKAADRPVQQTTVRVE